MKSNLSKFCKTLLLGAAFAVVGCTDYDEDIRKVTDKCHTTMKMMLAES